MSIPVNLREATKVIGYFSYTKSGEVCCDGDACVIAGTEERMRFYINKMGKSKERDIIKKTRFDEIVNGMIKGGAYSFDEKSYNKFYDIAITNGINGLPAKENFSKNADLVMNLIRIQFFEL